MAEGGEAAAPSTLVTIGSEPGGFWGLTWRCTQNGWSHISSKAPPTRATWCSILCDGHDGVVAKALGRQYIGFDISEEYVNFGRERLERGPYLEELAENSPKGVLFDYGHDSTNATD